jgi:pimeloyl-ACP methyl ester carboxylesterase
VRSLVLVASYAVQRVTWWQRAVGQVMTGVIASSGTWHMARLTHWLRPAGGGRPLDARAAALTATMLATNNRQCLGDALHLSGQFDSTAWLHRLQVPTLVAAGNADCVILPRQAKVLAGGIPGAHLALLDDAGHALPLSHPVELTQLIVPWLERVDTPQPPHAATLALPDRPARRQTASERVRLSARRSSRVLEEASARLTSFSRRLRT